MEIVQQRLERESNLSLVQTAPNVTYEILTKRGETSTSPTRRGSPTPATSRSSASRSRVNFIIPSDCIGAMMQLCEDRRGVYLKTEYMTPPAPSCLTNCRWPR